MSNLVRCKDRFTYLSSERIGTLLVYSLIGNHIKKGIVHVTTLAAMVSIRNCRNCNGEVKWKNYIHLVVLYSPILGAGTGFNPKYCDATHLSNQ